MAAGNRGYDSSKNPFYYDNTEEVDDMAFLNHPRQGTSGYMLGNSGSSNANGNPRHQQQQLYDEISQIQDRSLRSTQRTLALVDESEQAGVQTAEELMKQREQLQNSERKMDDINQSLKVSQKHLNSMKSIFGGIKSYFSKGSDQPKQVNLSAAPEPTASGLHKVVENVRQDEPGYRRNDTHPGMKLRGLDTSGFLDDDDAKLDQKFMGGSSSQPPHMSARFQEAENQLDRNLDDLSIGLGRLKGLATGLGQEIDEQNDIVERITTKVEKADINVGRQNKQMQNILR